LILPEQPKPAATPAKPPPPKPEKREKPPVAAKTWTQAVSQHLKKLDASGQFYPQEAIAGGYDQQLTLTQRAFIYLPYMHSESAAIHRLAVDLYSVPGLEDNLTFERRHQAIIDRFGRYPHRNAILGRRSTAEEIAFLQTPGSSF
jgi:uncharacterized protein (DUF924 family)